MTIWQDPQVVERFKELYNKHLSFTQMAAELSAEFRVVMTRNSAIGYAHRRGLTRADAPRVTKPRQRYNAKTLRRANKLTQMMFHGAPQPVPIPQHEPVVQSYDFMCQQNDLTNKTCRYPLWSDDTPASDKYFCGHPSAQFGERSYCLLHSRIAYSPSKVRPAEPTMEAAE